MIIEDYKSESFEIRGASALDHIQVVTHDMGMNRGRIIIACQGAAWTAYWGSMMCETVAEFVSLMGADYLCNKLAPPSNQTKGQDNFRMRVSLAVKEAIAGRIRAVK